MLKNLLLTFLVCCTTGAFAQVSDQAVENMMTRRALTMEDYQLSMAHRIPVLYKAGATDTINAIISYYKKNYNNINYVLYYELILAIKNRAFKEEFPNLASLSPVRYRKLADSEFYAANIIYYMRWYHRCCLVRTSIDYYTAETRAAYGDYFDFLRDLAEQQLDIPGLSTTEKWLLMFLSRPDEALFKELEKPTFNGTTLQDAWNNYKERRDRISGMNTGLLAGAFFPTGNMKMLGTHPAFGFVFGGRKNRVMIDANLSLRFGRTPDKYLTVGSDNMLYETNYYFGGYIGLDGGYELWRKQKHELDFLMGFGWDGFDALPGDSKPGSNNKDDKVTRTINSVNFNLGLGYRFNMKPKYRKDNYVSRRYLALQAKYNLVNYRNTGGTDLSGKSITLNLLYGAYRNRPREQGIVSGYPTRK